MIPTQLPYKDMAWIPAGTFWMGSNEFYPEEQPVHQVTLHGFWIDSYPVTNAAFRRFVKATGYQTVAEQPLDPADFPGVPAEQLQPGALVFYNPGRPVRLDDIGQWWKYVIGASWQHPEGPNSNLAGRERHPVVQVAYQDALAFAAWARKALPTEAEWEYAARGGLEGATYAWGNEFAPKGRIMANTWQGTFPWQNTIEDGYAGTSPVGSFPANGYRLYDMAGNVWQWTTDAFQPQHAIANAATQATCCTPTLYVSHGAAQVQHVIKGGSYLCAPNYCLRYRPAARQGQVTDTATSHIGFRCIVRG